MDTFESIESSPSSSSEGIVTSDIENAATPSSTKNEVQDFDVDIKNSVDDINNDDCDEDCVIEEDDDEYEDDEDDNEDRESCEHDESQEEDEEYGNTDGICNIKHERSNEEEDDSLLSKPSSSTCIHTVSCYKVNTVAEQHALLMDSSPTTFDSFIEKPPILPIEPQLEDHKAHLNRLKSLRQNIEYIEKTNWLYKPIEELIGHTENNNKKF